MSLPLTWWPSWRRDTARSTSCKQPAGRCALYQVGDLARVMDLTVLPAFDGRDVERALTTHVLALARRLTMRHIFLQIADDDATRRDAFERAGFVPDGTIAEFARDERESPGHTE